LEIAFSKIESQVFPSIAKLVPLLSVRYRRFSLHSVHFDAAADDDDYYYYLCAVPVVGVMAVVRAH
jgi:hypothetical protein